MIIRILHFISSIPRGGRERQFVTIASNTDHKKYKTYILFLNEAKLSYLDEYDLNKSSIHINKKTFVARLIRLNKIIKDIKPDIVYTWGNIESIMIMLLKPYHTYKFINGSVRHGIRSKRISHYFRTIILHLSKYVVANSHAGLRANNLKKGYVLYNGIDNKFFNKGSQERSVLRRELVGITNGIPILISVANLVPYKDYHTILKALNTIKEKYIDFYYLILGDGPMKEELNKIIKEYYLYNRVKIIGNVNNVYEYLKISDLFIHSSKGEGCSNAILEAMASGLPIVATNTGGTGEIVSVEFGRLYQYKNSNQLSGILTELLSDKNKMNQMGRIAYITSKNNFTVDKMMNDYYRIIDEIYTH